MGSNRVATVCAMRCLRKRGEGVFIADTLAPSPRTGPAIRCPHTKWSYIEAALSRTEQRRRLLRSCNVVQVKELRDGSIHAKRLNQLAPVHLTAPVAIKAVEEIAQPVDEHARNQNVKCTAVFS